MQRATILPHSLLYLTNMNSPTHEIVAVFANPDDALNARTVIEETALRPREALRISAERVLHVQIDLHDLDRVTQALRSAGAVGIRYSERTPDPGWMSHQNGRVTGAAVTPGEGDSEAGAPD
jgi:hypothetical protein